MTALRGPAAGLPPRLAVLLLSLLVLLAACDATSPTAAPTGAQPTGSSAPTATLSGPPSPTASATDLPTASPTAPPSSAPPSPLPTPTFTPPTGLLVERTLPYATTGDCGQRTVVCQQYVDVYRPAAGAGPWPVAVMIHGPAPAAGR